MATQIVHIDFVVIKTQRSNFDTNLKTNMTILPEPFHEQTYYLVSCIFLETSMNQPTK